MPRRAAIDPNLHRDLMELLASARRILQLRVVFRDYLDQAGLADPWRWRLDPACAAVKAMPGGMEGCLAFCARQVVRELSITTEGRLHTCPFGHTEAVVPVVVDGQCHGQLIAGPMWCGSGRAPRAGLERADTRRADDVLLHARALALRCAELIARHQRPGNRDRRNDIIAWIQIHHAEEVSLVDLARKLRLSSSRCGHLVRTLTGRTFPELLRDTRLAQAASLLHQSQAPVQEIAAQVGFSDAGYFIRVFRRRFGVTPQGFRQARQPSTLAEHA